MKKLFLILCACSITILAQAQSKVFKEVSEDVRSQMKVITQDDKLVGYLIFTQLEKASEDSFNYKISLMDENLNDIGTVNFREEGLDLQAVTFEQDVLCLAYFKSNIRSGYFSTKNAYNASDAQNYIFTQLLTLDGKITKTNKVKVNLKKPYWDSFLKGPKVDLVLKHQIQLKNVTSKGFICFYGDDDGCNLLAYDLTGKGLWEKNIPENQAYGLLASGSDVYLLQKTNETFVEGGYNLLSYNFNDGTAYDKIPLQDKSGNSLKVLTFANDPVSGKIYLSGNIIDQDKGRAYQSAKNLSHGTYAGVFTIDINGHSKNEIKKTFTYWNDGSKAPEINKNGFVEGSKSYVQMTSSFRDFKGETYFIGSGVVKRPKVVAIAFMVGFAALYLTGPIPSVAGAVIMPSLILAFTGTAKSKITDAVLMKMDIKGNFSYVQSMDCQSSRFIKASYPLSFINGDRNYYGIENADTKNNYILVDDGKKIQIYGVNQKKVVRTISHKDGKVLMNVYPAKEGHMMVVEYNKKEKYTRLSIEALN